MGKIYSIIMKTLCVIALFSVSVVNAQTHITDTEGLNNIRNKTTESYILDNDIDLTDYDWTPFEFSGTLDGNGYSIKNLEVELNDERAGLFSNLNGATIKNLGIEDVYIKCNDKGGALAGYASKTTVEKCFATGEINSGGLTGGFFGLTDETTVSESYTEVEVNGHDHVGGIIGHMNGGIIENCYTNSTIYSDGWQVGGIVGWAQNAGTKITKCYAKGSVKSEGGFTGGILGIADGSDKVVEITECIAAQTSIETVSPDIEKSYRIIANHSAGVYSKNYGLESITITDPYKFSWENDVNGKDGATITSAQFISAVFYTDSLTWNFENVWKMTNNGPVLQWVYTEPTTSVNIKKESQAKVFSKYGTIYVEGAETGANISIYNLKGIPLYQGVIKSSNENYTVNQTGLSIVLIESSKVRSFHKLVNY